MPVYTNIHICYIGGSNQWKFKETVRWLALRRPTRFFCWLITVIFKCAVAARAFTGWPINPNTVCGPLLSAHFYWSGPFLNRPDNTRLLLDGFGPNPHRPVFCVGPKQPDPCSLVGGAIWPGPCSLDCHDHKPSLDRLGPAHIPRIVLIVRSPFGPAPSL